MPTILPLKAVRIGRRTFESNQSVVVASLNTRYFFFFPVA